MTRVFGYLAWCSARNRLASQLRQLRSPRYLAALAFGLAYLWLVLGQRRAAPTAPREVETTWVELIGALAVAGAVAAAGVAAEAGVAAGALASMAAMAMAADATSATAGAATSARTDPG